MAADIVKSQDRIAEARKALVACIGLLREAMRDKDLSVTDGIRVHASIKSLERFLAKF